MIDFSVCKQSLCTIVSKCDILAVYTCLQILQHTAGLWRLLLEVFAQTVMLYLIEKPLFTLQSEEKAELRTQENGQGQAHGHRRA